jgi:hypothetical protein
MFQLSEADSKFDMGIWRKISGKDEEYLAEPRERLALSEVKPGS